MRIRVTAVFGVGGLERQRILECILRQADYGIEKKRKKDVKMALCLSNAELFKQEMARQMCFPHSSECVSSGAQCLTPPRVPLCLVLLSRWCSLFSRTIKSEQWACLLLRWAYTPHGLYRASIKQAAMIRKNIKQVLEAFLVFVRLS